MKKLLLTLALVLTPSLAHAQCNGVVPNGTICGNVTGSTNTMRPTSTSVITGIPGGSNGQIQYNNAGAFGGFTAGGDLTFSVPNFTIANNAVSNAKLATMTQNTIKGAATSTAAADLAAPSCSGSANALQWLTNTGLQCATLGNVTGSGSPTVGDLTTFNNTSATAVVSPGYNIRQVPGLIPTTSTVTISNGSPGVVTWNSHGLSANDPIFFCTTGALPTGLTACVPAVGTTSANTYKSNPTLYYVVGSSIAANTFTVATSIANAKAGTAVNTSSAGSGTHTAFANAMACAGCIGEYKYNSIEIGSGISLVSGSAGQVWTTLSLEAGIWKLGGNGGVIKKGAGTPVFSHMHAGLVWGFSTIPTSPYNGTAAAHITSNDPNGWIFTHNPENIFLTTTTTINAVMTSDFAPTTADTAQAYGRVWAERVK